MASQLRGRAASPIRPGLIIKGVLLGQVPLPTGELVNEASMTELHQAYKELVVRENDLRPPARKRKPMTQYSFKTLFRFAQLLNLVELVREEPMQYPPSGGNLLQIRKPNGEPYVVESVRRIFKLTNVGEQDEKSWTNLCKAWIEKWPAPQAAEYAPPVILGRPRKEEEIEKEPREKAPKSFTPYKWRAAFNNRNVNALIEHLELLGSIGIESADVQNELTRLSGRITSWIVEADESLDEVKSIGYTSEIRRFERIILGLTAVREAILDDDIAQSIQELSNLISGP